MGVKYLWDTNVVVYFLQQQFPIEAERFIDNILKIERPIISAITEIELLCWKSANENDEKLILEFIKDALVIELEKQIKMKTVEIRKTSKLKLPDAIIAATALVHGFTLLTRNVDDFKNTRDLVLENPWNK